MTCIKPRAVNDVGMLPAVGTSSPGHSRDESEHPQGEDKMNILQRVGRVSVAAVAAAMVMVAIPASAGIANTKHNLGSTGVAGNNKVTTGTDEICVFCHTPHAANTNVEAPLWNKALPPTTYTTYSTTNSSTIDGTVLQVGSISLACLSCHDGTQAMDNIINAPGSGGYDTTGGGATGLGYTWAGPRVDADGKLQAGALTNLGNDLTNDHPIGIHYCGGGPNATTPAGACVDKDFNAPNSGVINGARVWWVDTLGASGTAAREKTDMILYTRNFGTTASPNLAPSVECGSCHDPHVEETAAGNAGATFLRIKNTGSAVCLACHNK